MNSHTTRGASYLNHSRLLRAANRLNATTEQQEHTAYRIGLRVAIRDTRSMICRGTGGYGQAGYYRCANKAWGLSKSQSGIVGLRLRIAS